MSLMTFLDLWLSNKEDYLCGRKQPLGDNLCRLSRAFDRPAGEAVLPSFGAKSSYYGDLWRPDPTKTKRNAEEQREV